MLYFYGPVTTRPATFARHQLQPTKPIRPVHGESAHEKVLRESEEFALRFHSLRKTCLLAANICLAIAKQLGIAITSKTQCLVFGAMHKMFSDSQT